MTSLRDTLHREHLDKLRQRTIRKAPQVRNKGLRKKVFERDHGVCCKCDRFDPKWLHDHIIPLEAGGADTLDNSQTLCRQHEKPKTAQDARDRAKAKRLKEKHDAFMARRQIGGGS